MKIAHLLDSVKAFSQFFTNTGFLADCQVAAPLFSSDPQLSLKMNRVTSPLVYPSGNYARSKFRPNAHKKVRSIRVDPSLDPASAKLDMLSNINPRGYALAS